MQQVDIDKRTTFNKTLGQIVQKIRKEKKGVSISKLAREYDLDRGNLSKLERGVNGCHIITAWKICEASGIKFSDFAGLLEEQLGSGFKFVDE